MFFISRAARYLLPLLLFAGGAQATDSGFYASVAAGTARSELSSEFTNSLASNFGSASLHEDKTDFAARIAAGYQLTRNFALQGSFGHYGTVDARADTTLPLGQITAERKVRAATLGIVGSLPLSDSFDLAGTLGAAFWRVENRARTVLPVSGMASRFEHNQNGVSPHVGLGLQYRLSGGSRLTLDVEHFRAGKRDDSGRSAVSAVFAGIKFYF